MVSNEKVIGELLKLPEIADFHYDDRDWGVGGIDEKLWRPKFRGYCVSRIERLKHFLEMPYVEDIFGGNDRARYVWRRKLSRDIVFEDLTKNTIFSISKLNGALLSESFMIRQYEGKFVDQLNGYVNDCERLMPFWEDQGKECIANRERYNAMKFEEKRSHVYDIKENVFEFLDCLANEKPLSSRK